MQELSINLEASKSVEDFFIGDKSKIKDVREGDGVQEAFDEAAAWIPSEKYLRMDLKTWLREFKISHRRSRPCRIEFVGFVEFDSSNIGHAAAIYEYKVTGPEDTIQKLKAAVEEDSNATSNDKSQGSDREGSHRRSS